MFRGCVKEGFSPGDAHVHPEHQKSLVRARNGPRSGPDEGIEKSINKPSAGSVQTPDMNAWRVRRRMAFNELSCSCLPAESSQVHSYIKASCRADSSTPPFQVASVVGVALK